MADLSVGTVRESRAFVRTVASIVLVAYTSLLVSPGVQAMQQASALQAAAEQAPAQERGNLGKALGRVKQELRVLAERPDALDRKPTPAERVAAKEALRAWRSQTRALVDDVRAEFAATGALIQSKNLPAVIRQRQAEATARFEAEVSAFEAEIDGALATTDAAVERSRAEAAFRRLDLDKLGRPQQKLDPNNLPNSSLKPDRIRTPKTKPEEFQTALLLTEPTARLAQAAGFDFSRLPGADNPSYLASSDEVVLTADIQAKVAELDRNLVAIYNWVRNNVHWQPSWGAIQDASHTLSSLRGNAFDIASLTIALLRASGIPARYVHGTIELPEDKFRNWAGGFQHIEAAMDFASAGGIPLVAVTSAGRITKIRMEHVWVEAATDFHPSRGAKNRSADSWVAMDPGFKQIEVIQGLDAAQITGIDPTQLSREFLASGTVNEAEGWVTGFNPGLLQNAQIQARAALENHIEQQLPNGTIGDVLGAQRIVEQTAPVLAASLPYRVVTSGARFAALPSSLQQRITFAFGNDILGDPIDPRTFPWARLNNKQVTLSFRPATQADEDALRTFVPEGPITDVSQLPGSIPAYLVRVVPELKVGETVLMSGGAMELGSNLDFVFNPRFVSAGSKPFSYSLPAGSYLAIAVIAGSVKPASMADSAARLVETKNLLESGQLPAQASARERLLGDMFHSGLLGYYAQYTKLGSFIGAAQRGHHHLAAGLGSFGYEPNVDTFFGVPRRIERGGAAMNIPIVNIVASDAPQAGAARTYAFQLGALSSVLEHAVPEQMFTSPTNPGEAISAVKALHKATAAGQRIYHVTRANQSQVLPLIRHDPATMDEIRAAISAGRSVITHTDSVSVPGWSGAGYVLVDEATGAAAWKIAGGQNGAFFTLLIFAALGFYTAIGLILAGVPSLVFLGLILLAWEAASFWSWISSINGAESMADIDRAHISALVTIPLPALLMAAWPLASPAIAAVLFGMAFTFMIGLAFG